MVLKEVLLELKIRLAAQAGEALGRITSADVTQERLTATSLIAAWERSWYEWAAGLAARQPAPQRQLRAVASLARVDGPRPHAGTSPVFGGP